MSPAPLDVVALAVFTAVMAAAVAPFLGSVREARAHRMAGEASALASGLMLAASYLLMQEGLHGRAVPAVPAFAAGALVAALVQRAAGISGEERSTAGRIVPVGDGRPVSVHVVHAVAESVAIAAAMTVSMPLGLYVTATLAVHNVAEGIALDRALARGGIGRLARVAVCAAARSPQGLAAVALFAAAGALGAGRGVLDAALGFAAGSLVYLVLTDSLPSAYRRLGSRPAAILTACATGIAVVLPEIVGR